LGPNGAGKTTTMRIITGYLPASDGEITVCGANVEDDAVGVQQNIGYLPEGGPLYNDMTPATFLAFIGKIRGLSDVQIKDRIEYVVRKLHLHDVLDQTIDTLSKGFKRRVALAQAILHDPQILVLDEPTDGLDPNQKFEVRQLILDMAKDKAIIISTHILEEVEAICSRAIIIAQGQIVASGAPEEIAAKAEGHNAVYFRLKKAPADTVLSDIMAIKDVAKVNVTNVTTIVAYPKNGKSIVSDIGDAVRAKKIVAEEIYQKKGKLDDAFRMLTNAETRN
jgi:ABC-2 type transport system ATP-binding protein